MRTAITGIESLIVVWLNEVASNQTRLCRAFSNETLEPTENGYSVVAVSGSAIESRATIYVPARPLLRAPGESCKRQEYLDRITRTQFIEADFEAVAVPDPPFGLCFGSCSLKVFDGNCQLDFTNFDDDPGYACAKSELGGIQSFATRSFDDPLLSEAHNFQFAVGDCLPIVYESSGEEGFGVLRLIKQAMDNQFSIQLITTMEPTRLELPCFRNVVAQIISHENGELETKQFRRRFGSLNLFG